MKLTTKDTFGIFSAETELELAAQAALETMQIIDTCRNGFTL